MNVESGETELREVGRLRGIVARLRGPGGCPWDREKTHASLRGGAIEEVYEMVEAIDAGDDAHFKEELGDLLLQVAMHAQIAQEEGRFDLEGIAAEVADKLVRRHPHVFGTMKLEDSEAVLKQWDEIKKGERASKGADADASVLDGVSAALPALMRAGKVQKRAARVGFDWDGVEGVMAKLREEIAEVEAEIASGAKGRLEDEIGDLLFTVVNLARKANCDAEMLLMEATNKFVRRFHGMEAEARRMGKGLKEMTMAEMDVLWERMKDEGGRNP